MKIRFLRNVVVDVEKPRLKEVWPTSFNKWTELMVEEIFVEGKTATLKTYHGDWILLVPLDAIEKIENEKKPVTL